MGAQRTFDNDGIPLSFIGETLFKTSSTAPILGGCCMGANLSLTVLAQRPVSKSFA